MGQKIESIQKSVLVGDDYAGANMTETTIFLSYSWSDVEMADRIDKYLSGLSGVTVKRDVRDIGPWKSIREFMVGIRQQDYAVLIISDSYLKSKNCMFEVTELMKEREYEARIFSVVVESDIYDSIKRNRYISYWEQECDKLEAAIRKINPENAVEQAADLKCYKNIASSIGEFLSIVADRNNPDIVDVEEQIEKVIKPVLEEDSESIAEGHMIMSDWGDTDGGRPTYMAGEVERNILGNQIVFNSIGREHSSGDCKTLYPGDEKNFVKVWWQNTGLDEDGLWESEDVAAEDGRSYMIQLDISSNNRKKNAVAKDTKVAMSIPSYSDMQIPVRGYIESSNAEPSKIWDGVVFSSVGNKPFHLKFRSNTATLYNESIGADGLQLSDDIVSKATEGGTLIGYDDLNGEIPGGSQSKVTAWIDVIYDTYTVISKVRKLGDKEWSEVVDTDLDFGENFIYNWGQATADDSLVESFSVVIVRKNGQ